MYCEIQGCKSTICNGEISFTFDGMPPSLQSSGAEKEAFEKNIHYILKDCHCHFTHDVSIKITYHTHVHKRYESPYTKDIDNMAKPLIDSLCGNNGIIVDDCQVQHLKTFWINVTGKEFTKIEILDDFLSIISKKKIIFVHFYNGLCIPLRSDMPKDIALFIAQNFTDFHTFRKRKFGDVHTLDYDAMYCDEEYNYRAGSLTPQRIFHISRVKNKGFRTITPTEISTVFGMDTA